MTRNQQSPGTPENNSLHANAVDWLNNAPRPEMPAAKKAAIQAQMMAHAQQQDFSSQPLRPDFTPIIRWAVIASIVVVVALLAAVPVTYASVPGDILYPLKQRLEQVEQRFATTALARAQLHLTQAQRRIDEAQILVQRNQSIDQIANSALEHMLQAADIARNEGILITENQTTLQIQTIALTVQLNALLDLSDAPALLRDSIQATQSSGDLLLPTSPTPTLPATATSTPTSLPTTTPSVTPVATTPTLTPQLSENSTATTIVLEGPVDNINNNIITVFDIDIEVAVDDPVLNVIQIGDVIRVEGDLVNDSEVIIIVAVTITVIDVDIFISEDGENVWRDNGNCSNPPPAWAPANGWRRRCEGNSNNENSGNSGNNRSRRSKKSSKRS